MDNTNHANRLVCEDLLGRSEELLQRYRQDLNCDVFAWSVANDQTSGGAITSHLTNRPDHGYASVEESAGVCPGDPRRRLTRRLISRTPYVRQIWWKRKIATSLYRFVRVRGHIFATDAHEEEEQERENESNPRKQWKPANLVDIIEGSNSVRRSEPSRARSCRP